MGLCKCPKKKVTNLFCFEHRVNVCEHCLVSNHPKCIVQSYLQWLQDSDYDPTCRLCGQNLGEDDKECVRLSCYDVFHWSCIDKYARTLPANTAPAGYTCPTCKTGIFPASNVVSPVAESLRKTLSLVNWARAGLGLPLIEERSSSTTEVAEPSLTASHSAPVQSQSIPQSQTQEQHHDSNRSHAQTGGGESSRGPPPYSHNPQSVVNMDDSTPYARGSEKTEYNPRKLFDTTSAEVSAHSHDHDEDKYKRRPAFQWFMRWFSSNARQRSKPDPNAALKRMAVILILCLLGFMTLVVILTRVGRASADRDPFLDPLANPNIRVAGD